MAETLNLKLPLISPNASADVPRDMNALAEAVDSAVIEKIKSSVPNVQAASLTQPGIVQLNDTINSSSITQAATPNAVKKAYEQAVASAQALVPDATTSRKGIVQLNDAINSTSTTQAATSSAVKKAYDQAVAAAQSLVPDATISRKGIVQLNDATNSTSTTQAATANAVKKAFDQALAAKPENYDGRVSNRGVLTVGSGKQFSTIQAAINSLPKMSPGFITIQIYPGTYNEYVTIERFHGGFLRLTAAESVKPNIQAVDIQQCTADIILDGLVLTSSLTGVTATTNRYLEILNCEKKTGYYGFEISKTSTVIISSCILYSQQTAIDISRGSIAYIYGLSGTNNVEGLSASSAIIFKDNVTLTATTREVKTGGAQIW